MNEGVEKTSFADYLPWIAAVTGFFAVVGSVWAAIAASMSTSAAFAQLELQRKPVIVLACTIAFRIQERAHNVAPPVDVLFLEPGIAGPVVPLDQTFPTYTADGKIIEYPPMYARCMLTNAGSMAVVEIEVPLTVSFFGKSIADSSIPQETSRRSIRVPFLKPGESYEFGVAQGSPFRASFTFDRSGTLTRIDTERRTSITVFVTHGTFQAENNVMNGFERRIPLVSKPQLRTR